MRPGFAFRINAATFLLNEYVVYYFLLSFCEQPQLKTNSQTTSTPLRFLVLADPHLLGENQGHWFDKLRREWQIYRSFRTAIHLFEPDAVFLLGDILDEGKWADDQQFERYVNRANEIFDISNRHFYAVVGNHDVGFHYSITKDKLKRFSKAFRSENVQAITLKGNVFVLLNSMGLDDDRCSMCNDVTTKLIELSNAFNCSSKMNKQNTPNCNDVQNFPNVKPVLLQHFPLFRESDASCDEVDSISPDQVEPFVPKHDCISKVASEKVLDLLQPRLVISGHTHSACRYYHNGVLEISVPSFSWRNRPNPSFLLVTMTPENYEVTKCFLPNEHVVIAIYVALVILLFSKYFIFAFSTRFFRQKVCVL